jgi:Kef-type K+ transport system membrane component KefB
MLNIRNRGVIFLFDNDRLSHWFAGAVLSWLAMFLLWGLLAFHVWLGVPTAKVAAFAGICCAVQLGVTPWLFSARATRENPRGRVAQGAAAVIVLLSAIALLFFYFLRQSWPGDIETRRFTTIAMSGTVGLSIIALITICVLSRRRKGGERSTPD